MEKDFDFAKSHVRMRVRVMNQHWNLLGPDLLGTITKDKKHGINHVTFAATIGTHNGWKTLVERPQSLFSIVRLEILVLNVGDHEPWPVAFEGQGRWRRRWNVNAVDMNSTVFIADFFRGIWHSLKKTVFDRFSKTKDFRINLVNFTSSTVSGASSVSMFSGGGCSTSISSSVIFGKMGICSSSEFFGFRKLKNKNTARATDLSQQNRVKLELHELF